MLTRTMWRKTVSDCVVCTAALLMLFALRHIAVGMLFSGEEAYGRYLDLYSNHTAYNNLKNIGRHLPYLQYLDVLMLSESGVVHRELSKETRFTKDYEAYVNLCSNAFIRLFSAKLYSFPPFVSYLFPAPDTTSCRYRIATNANTSRFRRQMGSWRDRGMGGDETTKSAGRRERKRRRGYLVFSM